MSDDSKRYFKKTHPAFPILDEKAVVDALARHRLPHALSCEIYAMTLLLWQTSPTLSKHHRPDIRYVWNLTVSALHDDFQAPSFSTVLTTILDLTGRPTTLVTYNATNIGRAVALAHILGLNRNPSKWNLDQRQKSLRVRAWWALLIHDSWSADPVYLRGIRSQRRQGKSGARDASSDQGQSAQRSMARTRLTGAPTIRMGGI